MHLYQNVNALPMHQFHFAYISYEAHPLPHAIHHYHLQNHFSLHLFHDYQNQKLETGMFHLTTMDKHLLHLPHHHDNLVNDFGLFLVITLSSIYVHSLHNTSSHFFASDIIHYSNDYRIADNNFRSLLFLQIHSLFPKT